MSNQMVQSISREIVDGLRVWVVQSNSNPRMFTLSAIRISEMDHYTADSDGSSVRQISETELKELVESKNCGNARLVREILVEVESIKGLEGQIDYASGKTV